MKKRITTQKKTEGQAAHSTQLSGEHVFDTVENLLRFDAAQLKAPPGLGERLAHSIRREPPAKGGSWWGRMFGG